MEEKTAPKSYDDELEDIEDLDIKELKVNPDYYLHNAILKAQAALSKDNIQEGFLQYRILVEHIEMLARANKILPSNYEEQITAYKKEKDFIEEKEVLVRFTKLANKKLQIILEQVFDNKTIETPMQLNPNKKQGV